MVAAVRGQWFLFHFAQRPYSRNAHEESEVGNLTWELPKTRGPNKDPKSMALMRRTPAKRTQFIETPTK